MNYKQTSPHAASQEELGLVNIRTRLHSLVSDLRSIRGILEGHADALLGGLPSSEKAARLHAQPSGMLAELHSLIDDALAINEESREQLSRLNRAIGSQPLQTVGVALG